MRMANMNYGIELEFKENAVNVLVVEHPQTMSRIITELFQQCQGEDGNFVLSNKDKLYKINKEITLILEPFSVNCNERKIITKLYEELKIRIEETMIEETAELNSKIINYLEKITMEVPYITTFQFEYDIKGLFKLLSVELEDKGESLCENIINYLKVLNQLCKSKIFIFLNLKSFLSSSEIMSLYEFVFYNKINLVLIENNVYSRIKGEETYIIDKDMCIISP